MRRRNLVVWSVFVAALAGLTVLGLPQGVRADETEEPPGLAEPNPTNPPFVRDWKRDRLEDWYDRREDVRDRREDVRDRREDRFDRREDVRDRREDIRDRRDDRIKAARLDQLRREYREALGSGETDRAEALRGEIHSLRQNIARDRREDVFDRREDRRDRREDFFDRREDHRDRREDFRDRREDWRDRRDGSPGYRRHVERPARRYAGDGLHRPTRQSWNGRRHVMDRPGPRNQPSPRDRFNRSDRRRWSRPQMADRRPYPPYRR